MLPIVCTVETFSVLLLLLLKAEDQAMNSPTFDEVKLLLTADHPVPTSALTPSPGNPLGYSQFRKNL